MARKRMIYPEFWTDEKLCLMSRDVRLFFIGLWNFADDEGKFESNPVKLKAQIFPIDADIGIEKIKEFLDILQQAKRIELYGQNGNSYGIILNFRKYQKINRPTPSIIPNPEKNNEQSHKKSEHSLNFNEHSLQNDEHSQNFNEHSSPDKYSIDKNNIEEIRKEKKKESIKKEKKKSFQLPDFIKTETWEGFVEMRNKIKKPLTDLAIKKLVNKLEKFKQHGEDIDKVLEQSIINCWQDVYPVKNKEEKNNGNGKYKDIKTIRAEDL